MDANAQRSTPVSNNDNVYSTLTTSRDQMSVWAYEMCVSLSTGDITRLSESVSSLHSLSPRWLTAELIPRLTPAVDWRAHVYTQTELTKGWNTYTGWWQRLMHTFYVKRTQAFLEHSNTEVLLLNYNVRRQTCSHCHWNTQNYKFI